MLEKSEVEYCGDNNCPFLFEIMSYYMKQPDTYLCFIEKMHTNSCVMLCYLLVS